jgi:hypothetical protein
MFPAASKSVNSHSKVVAKVMAQIMGASLERVHRARDGIRDL